MSAIPDVEPHYGAKPFFRRQDDLSAHSAPKPSPKFKTLSAFVGEFEPPSYLVEPVVRSGSVYTLTARTGAGKTAWFASLTLAIATGRPDILGSEVQQGRVAYLSFENPDDLRMRLMTAAFHINVDLDEISDRVLILDQRFKPEEILAELSRTTGEPFAAIVLDTLAAGFDGRDLNDNVATGEYLRRLRPLTNLPGRPTVIVAAHPTKNASDDSLIPFGGGAILNECDGNLCLSRTGDMVTFHWQGKLRGMDFEPRTFRFETVTCPDVVDAKGREMESRVMLPSTAEAAQDKREADAGQNVRLLRIMRDEPTASQREWAATAGLSLGSLNRRLNRLKAEKLTEELSGIWRVTKRGADALKIQSTV